MRQVRGGAGLSTRNFLIIALAIVISDQLAKLAVVSAMPLNGGMEVIPGFLDLVYFRNPGAAFGIFNEGGALKKVFLIGASVVALAVIGVLFRQSRDRGDSLASFALSLIAGGAVGNLIDRIREGEVIDFLYFHIGQYYWPAFNIADSAITIGVGVAIYSFYFRGKAK